MSLELHLAYDKNGSTRLYNGSGKEVGRRERKQLEGALIDADREIFVYHSLDSNAQARARVDDYLDRANGRSVRRSLAAVLGMDISLSPIVNNYSGMDTEIEFTPLAIGVGAGIASLLGSYVVKEYLNRKLFRDKIKSGVMNGAGFVMGDRFYPVKLVNIRKRLPKELWD